MASATLFSPLPTILLTTSICYLMPMPLPSLIYYCVKGSRNRMERAYCVTYLVHRPLTRAVNGPSESDSPAKSPKTSCFSSSRQKLGKRVSDFAEEWPILKICCYSGPATTSITLTFFSFIVDFISRLWSNWTVINDSCKQLGPKIMEFSIVDLPQPVSPTQTTISLFLTTSSSTNTLSSTETRFQMLQAILAMLCLFSSLQGSFKPLKDCIIIVE